MSSLLILGVALAVGLCCLPWALHTRSAQRHQWLALPLLPAYVAQHPACRTARGLTCYQCGSPNIHDRGLEGPYASRREVICHHCDTILYRNAL